MPPMDRAHFNLVAPSLTAKERSSTLEAIWEFGFAKCEDASAGVEVLVVPALPAQTGEHLFHVSFPGSRRDKIPTQHYLIAGETQQEAVRLAHDRYVREPRHRKGKSIRITLGFPPELR